MIDSAVVSRDLAQRLEAAERWASIRWLESWKRSHPSATSEFRAVCGIEAVFVDKAYPINQMIGFGLDGHEVEARHLDEVENFFSGHGVPSQIVLCPLAHPSLMKLLGERHYKITEFNNVLYRSLCSDDRFELDTRGYELKKIDAQDIDAAAEVQVKAFFGEATSGPATPPTSDAAPPTVAGGSADGQPDSGGAPESFLDFGRASFHMHDSLAYCAIVDGKIVASTTGVLIREHRLVALAGSATLPEYRRRGMQLAFLAQRLNDASAAGCDLAFIGSAPGSSTERNAARLGFRLAYTKVVMVRELDR
ncbi:MAG TPA: hypothetical protein VKY85_00480 [Candidatus Angelobacter sp.]|nr:hypothetical protein [Candidatus Angelobacter sp.]